MEATLIRVGNEEYAKSNNSYGLTTMLDRHAKVSGEKISFEFKGKSNKRHHIDVRDRQLAKIVKQCQELPDQEIFAYVDDEGAWVGCEIAGRKRVHPATDGAAIHSEGFPDVVWDGAGGSGLAGV